MKKKACGVWALLLALLLTACGTETVKENDLTEVDLDLTQLSSTMVYSEVYNMMLAPEKYEGKTIRITGMLEVYEDAGQTYFACIITDATACCAQGLEFFPKDGYRYPEDFPSVGEAVTVEGTFTLVSEGQYRYMQLVDADMLP